MAKGPVTFNDLLREPGPTVADYPPQYSVANPSASIAYLPQRWMLDKTKDGKVHSTLNITTLDGTKLNAVTTRSGVRSDLIIHQGTSTDSEPLAVARTRFVSFKVTLPGLAGQGDSEFPFKTKGWGITPQVTWQMTGRDGQQYDFEWLSKAGKWRLMRTGLHGQDCVASWIVSFSSSRLSGEFEFETVAAREQLGPAFPYLASISALAIGKLMRDTVWTNVGIMAGN